MIKHVHVAVGVIFNSAGKVLIAKRGDHQHQGGLWEFPGGKVEAGESVQSALARELMEEVGIDTEAAAFTSLIQIPFHYPDKSVLLDVWTVQESSNGEFSKAYGKEGQPINWVTRTELACIEFPAANKAIVNALLLPRNIIITPDVTEAEVIRFVEKLISSDIKDALVQLRLPSVKDRNYQSVAKDVYGILRSADVPLMWNCSPDLYIPDYADGLHISGEYTAGSDERLVDSRQLQSITIRDHEMRGLSEKLEADFCFVSPVKETPTHSEERAIGWSAFASIVKEMHIPVYALGGITAAEMNDALGYGAQGIAGISMYREILL